MSSIIVAYGSFKGKGQNYAMEFSQKYGVEAVAMNDISVDQVKKSGICIFIVSTYGKGVPPPNAEIFFSNLRESKEDLSNVKYAVLGLGSSKHKLYDQAGRDLYKELQLHHAQPLCQLYEVDARSADSGESSYLRWTRELESHLPLPVSSNGIKDAFSFKKIDPSQYKSEPPKDYSYAHITEKSPLLSDNSVRKSHLYTIQLPENIKYLAGDHFDILPQNDESVVNKVIESLKLNPGDVFEVECQKNTLIPKTVSIKDLFGQYIDLHGFPTQFMVRAFAEAAGANHNEEGKAKILQLHNPDFLTKYLQNSSVADFIIEFAKYGIPPLSTLATVLPSMSPRTYSASSAPSESRFAQIMVTDVFFGNRKSGLCTSFLRGATPETPIALRVVRGVYNPEEDVPILLFAVGVGLSPILSAIDDRKRRGFKSPIVLFFGWRSREESEKVLRMIQQRKDDGAITEVFCGFSREHGEKKYYIFDLLNDNCDAAWNYWKIPETAVYYCGPALGIPDKLKAKLEEIISVKSGVSLDDAAKISKKHPWYIESF